VQSIPENTLFNASEHGLIHSLIEEFRFNVPVIKEDSTYVTESGEAPVDIICDPMRITSIRDFWRLRYVRTHFVHVAPWRG
jgi:hypothetical protein